MWGVGPVNNHFFNKKKIMAKLQQLIFMIKIRISIFIWLNFVFSLPNSQIKLYNATVLNMMKLKLHFIKKWRMQKRRA
jgi:hypothetical protein